jgi:hypothetical protein
VITPPSMPGTAQFCKAVAVDDFSNSTGTSRTASVATPAD